MIYVGENKSLLCKGDFRPAQLYKGDKKIAGYKLTEFEGIGSVTLENCYNDKVYDVHIEGVTDAVITARGKNYFDVDKIPFNKSSTQPYNNGLKAMKTATINSTNKIPIYLPVGKTIYITMDVVASQIEGTSNKIGFRFFNSEGTQVKSVQLTATIAKKAYSFTLSEDISYIQFFFQANNSSNAVGDYVTMDNIMLRCEGDDTFEPYIEPQTVQFENGAPAKDIPTFKGTTIIEIESETEAVISGKYKKREVEQ